MKTNFIAMIWAVLLSVPVTFSQFSIQGNVQSSEGENLAWTKIKIKDTYVGALSDVDGNFEISNLKAGNYVLIFESAGYETLEKEVDLKEDITGLNIQLVESPYMYDAVIVEAVKAGDKTPSTYTNLDRKDIDKQNFGQDMPFLFQGTPSTVVTSDAGAGVGYTGIRIRGVDPTRTNVTINGIPINDSESHGTFWVNMPDFASSVDNIQIQRGVGTSSNGAAAFGASINVETNDINRKAYAVLDNSVGSFSTWKNTIKAGSGLINDKFTVDMRLSNIQSGGYIDRAASDLKSLYVSGAWLGKKSILKANVFMGREKTYQAWWGTPESVLSGNQDSIIAFADRNWIFGEDRDNLLNSGRTYNYYTYENEVDNYGQDHYQLHFVHEFNSKLNFSVAGHYTRGKGYFEQYKADEDFSTYGFDPLVFTNDTVTTTDIIRRRWLDNHFYGGIFSLNYSSKKGLDITWGGAANAYQGAHYGEVIWAEFASQSDIRDRYYENDAFKVDVASYVKATYSLKDFTFYGDVQYRHIDYSFLGFDEVDGQIEALDQKVSYDFINPKVGVMYDLNDKHNFYGSFAIANREPTRGDFVESTPASRPTHETLQNAEVGYRLKTKNVFVNANYYLMNYQNQLILTGQVNDVGAYIRDNVAKSYRMGVELEGGVLLGKKVSVTGNVTYSQNKIPTFIEYIDDYDNGGQIEITHTNTDLAFSPNLISSAAISYEPLNNLYLTFTSKYVGKQYLDNTSNESRKLDAYFVSHLRAEYSFTTKVFKEVKLGASVNNIFNQLYANNGYTYGWYAGGAYARENFMYPQAGINFLGRLTLTL
ncbi:MAG: TonB-dependent receptor [Crocinitomicaceae bacterium]